MLQSRRKLRTSRRSVLFHYLSNKFIFTDQKDFAKLKQFFNDAICTFYTLQKNVKYLYNRYSLFSLRKNAVHTLEWLRKIVVSVKLCKTHLITYSSRYTLFILHINNILYYLYYKLFVLISTPDKIFSRNRV